MNTLTPNPLATLAAAFLIGIASLGANLTNASAADAAPPNQLPNPMDFLGAMSRLNLDEKQVAAIQKLLAAHAAKADLSLQRCTDAERALRTAINADPLDEKLVRRKADDLGAVITDTSVDIARLRADILALLNKDQRETFLAMQKQLDQLETGATRVLEFLRLLTRMAQLGQLPK